MQMSNKIVRWSVRNRIESHFNPPSSSNVGGGGVKWLLIRPSWWMRISTMTNCDECPRASVKFDPPAPIHPFCTENDPCFNGTTLDCFQPSPGLVLLDDIGGLKGGCVGSPAHFINSSFAIFFSQFRKHSITFSSPLNKRTRHFIMWNGVENPS